MAAPWHRFLFDQMMGVPAMTGIRFSAVEVLHVLEIDLGGCLDREVLHYAAREDRILVTRNHQDFCPVVKMFRDARGRFPGVLFIPPSIPPADPEAQVRAFLGWVGEHPEVNPISRRYGWLRPRDR